MNINVDLQNTPDETNQLGQLIRRIMVEQHISLRKLAEMADVGVATISNVLEQGSADPRSGVRPAILSKVADVLDIEQATLAQEAGHIAKRGSAHPLSAEAVYVAQCFDLLSADQRELIHSMIYSLINRAGLSVRGDRLQQLSEETYKFQRKHAEYCERPFGVLREIGRKAGNLTRTSTRALLLWGDIERIQGAFQTDGVSEDISAQRIEEVLEYPDVGLILNILLQHQGIETSIEKLYWLTHTPETAGTPIAKLNERFKPYRDFIRDLWSLLRWAAESS